MVVPFVLITVFKIKLVFTTEIEHFSDADKIDTWPLSIFRSDRIFHRTFRKIVYTAVGRWYSSPRSESEKWSNLCKISHSTHGKLYLVLVRLHILKCVGIEKEPTIQFVACVYVSLLNITFCIERLILKARDKAQTSGNSHCHEGCRMYQSLHILNFHHILGSKDKKKTSHYQIFFNLSI